MQETDAPAPHAPAKRGPVRRLLRIAWRTGLVALLLLGVLAAALLGLLGTRAGSDWLLRTGAERAGVGLDYAALRGTLLGRLEIDDLDVDADGTHVQVRRAVLHWDPAALLSPALVVKELAARGVRVRTPDTAPSQQPPRIAVPALPALTLPLPVRIETLALDELRLGDPDGPPALARLRVRIDAEGDRVTVSDLALARDDLAVAGELSAALRGDWPLDGRLSLTGAHGELPIDLALVIAGNARAPALEAVAREPAALRASLQADLREHPPRADLALDWDEIALPASAPLASPGGRLRAHTEDLAVSLELDARVSGAPGGVREVGLRADGRVQALEPPFAGALDLDWRVLTEAASFAGSGRVAGDPTALQLEHTLQQPFTVATRGTVAPRGAATEVDLEGDWRDLAWPPGAGDGPASPSGRYAVKGGLADLTAQVEAVLTGAGGVEQVTLDLAGGAAPEPPHAFSATLAWQAQTAPVGALRGAGRAEGDSTRVRFEHDLDGPGAATVRLAGHADLGGKPAIDVQGDWRDLRWPLEGDAVARSPQGRVTLRGPLDALAVILRAETEAEPVGTVSLRATTTVTPEQARDLDLAADLLGGSLTARGRVGWAGGVTAALAIDADGIDPGHFDPRAAGSLQARLGVDLAVTDGHPVGSVDLQRLGGTLGGYPVRGAGRVNLTAGGAEAREVVLETGSNRLEVSGRVEQTLALDYRLDAPALEQLWPDLAGALQGDGSVGGRPEAPVVRARLSAKNLRAGGLRLGTADLDADVDLAVDRASRVSLSARGLGIADQVVDRVDAALEGRRGEHRLTVTAEAPEGRLELAARGGLADGGRWKGELRTLDLLGTPLGDWRLERPSALDVGPDGAETGNACVESDGARLCARVARAAQGAQEAELSLAALPIARLGTWLPDGLEVEGALDAQARALSGTTLTATATVSATPTRITLPEAAAGEPITLSLDDTVVEARHGPEGSDATLRSRINGDGRVQGRVTVGPAGSAPPALGGEVQASLPDLSPFGALVPAVSGLAGRLQADLALAGNVADPRVRGVLSLSDGTASVSAAGITVERTALEVRGSDDGRFTMTGEAHSGPGSIAIEGKGQVDGERWAVELKAKGDRFEAAKLVTVQALVSPDLELKAGPEQLAVRGKVHVPQAQITVKEVPPGVVQVSDDETLVGEEPAQPPAWRRNLDVALDVSLGDEVRVSAFGLDAGLAGGLAVRVDGTAAPTGRGTVSLEGGRFTAYGQDLSIRRGRLLFAGPLDNPGLDVEAVRDAGEVTAGIAVSGNASRIQSRVFSEPPLPQADALAWLLTGRGLSSASQSEGNALASAAVALGVEQSEQVTRQIGSALGLDQLSVAAGESLEETSLVLGKQLTPQLFIRYALGVMGDEGRVELEYKITDNISVEGESGAAHGADVLYRLER